MTIGKFNAIGDYLGEFKGEIKFQYIREEVPENEEEIYEANPELIKHALEDNSPRFKEEFESFFELCKDYRNTNSISDNELVILLTNQRNDNNYFGYCSQNMKNVFIQCSNWGDILGEGLNDIFPIVYEIAAWTLRFLLFLKERQMISFIPPVKTGCVMDMCVDKRDISFKMRTGDIRPSVMQLIKYKRINPGLINQLISIFEKIRMGILFRDRVGITHGLSRLELREFGKKFKLVLVDFGDLPLSFEPIETIIYIIFLLKEEGIRLKHFDQEIDIINKVFHNIYLSKSDNFVENKVKNYISIENSTLLNENISKINGKLRKVLPDNIISNYLIDGKPSENYRISLDRSLVDLSRL